jgi:1-acyl-sn-glycerol-3-phosphate acyltransferase
MKICYRISLVIVSLLLWAHFLLSSILLTPFLILLWLVTRPFDPQLRLLHKFSCFWGAQYIWVNPLWSLKIQNKARFNDKFPQILVSNHQSLVDILVIYSLFKHFKWTSKVENFRLPFVGWVLTFNNSIPVHRGAYDAYVKFSGMAMQTLCAGSSIVMFPEGTRSMTGKLGKFKEGAFMLAHDAKVPILPVVIQGTSSAIPKKGWIIRSKQKITLKILDPVPYADFKELSVKETSAMIYEKIQKALEN